jgi:hypothetical protein
LPPGASDEGPDPLREFAGIWSGTSVSTIAAAKVRIEFDINQEGKKFKADYRCAAGDAVFLQQ